MKTFTEKVYMHEHKNMQGAMRHVVDKCVKKTFPAPDLLPHKVRVEIVDTIFYIHKPSEREDVQITFKVEIHN